LYRKLPKVTISLNPVDVESIERAVGSAQQKFGLTTDQINAFFVKTGVLENHAYKTEGGGIRILQKDGSITDVAESSDNYNLVALKETVVKHYLIHWG
jgi:hypothetical protein